MSAKANEIPGRFVLGAVVSRFQKRSGIGSKLAGPAQSFSVDTKLLARRDMDQPIEQKRIRIFAVADVKLGGIAYRERRELLFKLRNLRS